MGIGKGETRVSAQLHLNSGISVCVGSRFFRGGRSACSFLGTSGRLSVVCRSRGVVLLSGGINILYRPSGRRCISALVNHVGHCLCRGNRCSPSERGSFIPSLIGHVSHGANKVMVTTGGTRSLHVLGRGVGSERLRGFCLYILVNEPGLRDKVLGSCLVGSRGGGAIHVCGGRIPSSGRVHAGCQIVSAVSNLSLARMRLLANEARRVHTRFTFCNAPLLNSKGCNDGRRGHGCNSCGERFLCSCGLAFSFAASTKVLSCLSGEAFRTNSI